jgi:hypothetical protein
LNEIAELNLQSGDSVIAHFTQHTVSVAPISKTEFDAIAFPSVFRSETNVAYNNPQGEKISIRLFNSIGMPVMIVEPPQQTGGNKFILNLSGRKLPAGIYLLNFQTKNSSKTIRLVYSGE